MRLLENKTVIVTGASSGIGRATALLFARHGASLVLNGRSAAALAEVEREVQAAGGAACAVPGDVGEEATHAALVAAAVERFGGLHAAINSAGVVGAYGRLEDIDLADWDALVRTNLTGAMLGARAQIPAIRAAGGGAIVFVSSFVGTSAGIPGMACYGATKAALMGLVRGITADHAAEGIRANALLPGGTDTPAAGTAEQKQWAAGLHALKRIAQPEEIAQAALFLASDMASFVAGSALVADGGNAAVK
jgi:NAD(P)-dependent dehydrogenase (short-subunit alcohol dehydrogenase family)